MRGGGGVKFLCAAGAAGSSCRSSLLDLLLSLTKNSSLLISKVSNFMPRIYYEYCERKFKTFPPSFSVNRHAVGKWRARMHANFAAAGAK